MAEADTSLVAHTGVDYTVKDLNHYSLECELPNRNARVMGDHTKAETATGSHP